MIAFRYPPPVHERGLAFVAGFGRDGHQLATVGLRRGRIINGDDVKRIESILSIIIVQNDNKAAPDCNKIRMRNRKSAAIAQSNDERAEIWPESFANVLKV